MKIEVGKKYNLRNGDVVEIAIDWREWGRDTSYPFESAYQFSTTWTSEGKWHVNTNNAQDIISEHIEKTPQELWFEKYKGVKMHWENWNKHHWFIPGELDKCDCVRGEDSEDGSRTLRSIKELHRWSVWEEPKKTFTGNMVIGWYAKDEDHEVRLINAGFSNHALFTHNNWKQYSRSPIGPWISKEEMIAEVTK